MIFPQTHVSPILAMNRNRCSVVQKHIGKVDVYFSISSWNFQSQVVNDGGWRASLGKG